MPTTSPAPSTMSFAFLGAACVLLYLRSRRALREEIKRLGEANRELLCEARLLALELNKGGDPAAIIQDPTLPTITPERNFTSDCRQQPRDGPSLWKVARQLYRQHHSSTRVLRPEEPGQLRTVVIGVCGMSCSGKSTVSSVLRSYAAEHGTHVPVICLDDSYSEWMFDDPSENQPTNFVPSGARGRAWKNWESPRCVNWPQFERRLRAKIAVHSGYTPYIVVEGFLLLENAAAAGLLDHVISIEVTKEVAWQRRLSRALAMAAGSKDASGMDNYEQLPVYAMPHQHAQIRSDAASEISRLGEGAVFPGLQSAHSRVPVDLSKAAGEYDWLRLYFDEVVWPEAEVVRRHVASWRGGGRESQVHRIDGDRPPSEVELSARRVIASAIHGDH